MTTSPSTGKPTGLLRWVKRVGALALALLMTLACFMVLPLMQTIGAPPDRDLLLRSGDLASLEPPPPPPAEPEPEPEPEPEEPPPDLQPDVQPLDLSQIELALNPGFGGSGFGQMQVDLPAELGGAGGGADMDRIFSLAELDQKPRPTFQKPPRYPRELRRQGRGGIVTILLMVDVNGRVQNPRVEKSTDPAFNRAALEAVSQWRFEPGTRGGEKVPAKVRVPIRFDPP